MIRGFEQTAPPSLCEGTPPDLVTPFTKPDLQWHPLQFITTHISGIKTCVFCVPSPYGIILNMTKIKFGTSGWRAIIADEFTFANVRLATAAIGRCVKRRNPSPTLLVGYDTRFASEDFRPRSRARAVIAEHSSQTVFTGRSYARRRIHDHATEARTAPSILRRATIPANTMG